jgi:hypothetical protein
VLSLNNFHPFQHNATTMLYEHDAIIGIVPTGGGKTSTGLTAFDELKQDGVVSAGIVLSTKKVALSVWPREPAEWTHLAHLVVTPLLGTPAQREKALAQPGVDLHTVGFDNIEWLLEQVSSWKSDDPRLGILIIDEFSKLRNPRGTWAKAARKLTKLFKIVWLLGGSPRPNSELDWFVPVSIVSRDRTFGKSFDKWRRANFFPTDYEQRNWEIHQHYLPTLHADVAKHSFKVPMSAVPRPASDPIIHRVQLPAAARQHYKEMERKLFTSVKGVDVVAFDAAVSSGKLAQLAQGFLYDDEHVAHAVHAAKSDAYAELLDSMGGDAAAIVYWFNEDLVRLRDMTPGLVWLGEDVDDKRALEIEDEWNAGNIEHLALHPASAGHGLNLQKVQAQLIHYALTWSAEMYDQVVARVARQGYVGGGGQGSMDWLVLNHHIVAEDTVDEAKMARVEGKLTAQQIAMQYIQSVGLT